MIKKYTIGILTFAIVLWTQGCSKDEFFNRECVKAEFVSLSDSYCGGPHKIRILKGSKSIKKLYSGSKIENGSIITTTVPPNLQKSGSVFYFKPVAAQPKICTADVSWYTEVGMVNTSEKECP